MASIDMCEHDWPGSGCRECAIARAADTTPRDVLNGLKEALAHMTAFIEQNYNPLAVLPYNLGPARAALAQENEHAD